MEIDERELRYPATAPLRAWRLFRVRRDRDGDVMLSSPMFHNPEHVPWTGLESVAVCHEDHPAPAPGCRCGIYGALEGSLDSLPGYLVDTAYQGDPWVYAEIGCFGTVFVDRRGVRAQRARLISIAVPHSFASIGERLRSRYAVAVVSLDAAPGWIEANRRETGPPSADATNISSRTGPKPRRTRTSTASRTSSHSPELRHRG
jgi:hypothetical protein